MKIFIEFFFLKLQQKVFVIILMFSLEDNNIF